MPRKTEAACRNVCIVRRHDVSTECKIQVGDVGLEPRQIYYIKRKLTALSSALCWLRKTSKYNKQSFYHVPGNGLFI